MKTRSTTKRISISSIVITRNEDQKIENCLRSLLWTNEIVLVDMMSTDKTVERAKRFGAKIFYHKPVGYVEPARNFSIKKAINPWVLVIDADEQVPLTLRDKLLEIVKEDKIDYVAIPRKNIIFKKWIRYAGWWPDHQIRFFKKGRVWWTGEIHKSPETTGKGRILPAAEKYAIVHYNYLTISEFVEKLNIYTDKHAERILREDYQFHWIDLIRKPLSEFVDRYFRCQGFRDGLHGFILSNLMAFYFFIIYAKIWEKGVDKDK